MDLGTYQVVSEHSILSAQKKIRDAAMEFLEEESFNNVLEWKGSLREVKNLWERRVKGERRRSRRDHAPCRRRRRNGELSEKDYEIYLDLQLQMLQQFYVTEKPREPNEGYIEPEAPKSETGESEKENKETADCVSLPSPALVPKQIGNTKEECRFSEDIVHVQSTIPNVADIAQKASMHHRDVELTLAEKTCTNDEPERCRRDASGQIRSDLRERESLIIRTGTSVSYKLHARPPEPPEPPDRGLSTTEVFELVPMNNRVHQNLIINSTQLNNERKVSEEESEMENLKVTFPTIIEHQCSFLLDCGEEREARGGFHERKKIDCTPYYNFNAWVFRDLNQLMKKRNTIEWTAAPSFQNHADHVGNFCLEISQLHGKEQVGDLSGKWEMIYDGEDIELPVSEMGHNYPIEVVKIIKLIMGLCSNFCKGFWLLFKGVGKIIKFLVGLGGNCCSGQMQLQNISMMEPLLVHQWDPGGFKQDGGIQEGGSTCACHGNPTLQHQQAMGVPMHITETASSSVSGLLIFLEEFFIVIGIVARYGLGRFLVDTAVEFTMDKEMVIVSKCHVRQGSILVPRRNFDFAIISDVPIEDFRPLKWMSLLFIVVKIEHIQSEPGGIYYSPSMWLAGSLHCQLWDPGGRRLLLFGSHCSIQQMEVLVLRQVMHEDVEILIKGKQHPT